jgi:hypothetical protein
MDPKKLEILEEIIEHLSSAQASVLKDLIDKSMASKEDPSAMPGESSEEVIPKESDIDGSTSGGELMGMGEETIEDAPHPEMEVKPGEEMGGEGEMSDEELEELLKQIC